jgi:putative hydrolase of the HAD superfamily
LKYHGVIFDLFGTLILNFSFEDYKQTIYQIAGVVKAPPEAFHSLWMELFDESLTGFFATPEAKIEHICRKLGIAVSGNTVKQAAKIRYDHEASTMLPRPEAEEVLVGLKSRNLKIGLISDCSAEAPAEWPNTPLAPWFDVTIFSCQVKMKKPDPEIYKLALKQLKLNARDCLYVGDGNSQEMRGARAVGLTAVLLKAPGEGHPNDFRQEQEQWAQKTIASLTEVLEIVDNAL